LSRHANGLVHADSDDAGGFLVQHISDVHRNLPGMSGGVLLVYIIPKVKRPC
jgi:hypothetical protein